MKIWYGGALLFLAGTVWAQTSSAPAPVAEPASAAASAPAHTDVKLAPVAVNLNRDPEWKSYKQMKAGEAMFKEKHRLAPKADLYFAIRPLEDDFALSGVTLALVLDEGRIPLPLDILGRFQLPDVQTANTESAEFVLNKNKALYNLRPEIRTTGIPDNFRRLGDLRLQCEVHRAVIRDELSLLKRGVIGLLGGGCESRLFKSMFRAPRPVIGIRMAHADRAQTYLGPTGSNGKYSDFWYYVPLHDQTWPDDTLVEMLFKEPQPAS